MPTQLVVGGAMMQCTMGVAPSTLQVLPLNRPTTPTPAATIMDNKPMVNIPPFGMCTSLVNPTVASATAAALGVLTPMPCIPNIPAPWVPGTPTVLIDKMPALNSQCKAICAYGGQISILNPGQFTTQLP